MGITTDNATSNDKFINLLANWAVEQEHDISFNKTDNHCIYLYMPYCLNQLINRLLHPIVVRHSYLRSLSRRGNYIMRSQHKNPNHNNIILSILFTKSL